MPNDDLLLVGLSPGETSHPTPSTETPDSTAPSEAELETAARLTNSLQNKQAAAVDLEPDALKPRLSDAAPLVAAPDLPAGAVTAADGQPFSDFDSANYKADQMHQQTGDIFFVCALGSSSYVVLAQSSAGAPADPDQAEASDASTSSSFRDIPVDQLTLEDFPDTHPVHKCGLARYKRYMKKDFKFKPAYRSMWPLLVVAGIGTLVYLLPVHVISLLPQDVINNILSSISPEKFTLGVAYLGAALGVFASGKILVQRHIHRYTLHPGFAKYEYGILKRESSKIAYNNISNYEVNQSVLGRLLNYGDMELASPGTNDSEIKMINVFAPQLIEAVLEGKIEEARQYARR